MPTQRLFELRTLDGQEFILTEEQLLQRPKSEYAATLVNQADGRGIVARLVEKEQTMPTPEPIDRAELERLTYDQARMLLATIRPHGT